MAFTDPQSVTISGTAVSLPRVLTGTQVGNFVSADGVDNLTVDPRGTSKRRRNVARHYRNRAITINGVAANDKSMVSFTIDRPQAGVSDADIEAQASGLLTWLTAGSNANLKKLIAGEN